MNPWRPRLLVGVLATMSAGWGWMLLAADPVLRGRLLLLSVVFGIGTVAVGWHYRARVTRRLATAYVALGSIVHTGMAAAIVGADVLWERGLAPAMAEGWVYFAVGALGITASAVTWTRARGGSGPPLRVTSTDAPEPAPPPSAELDRAPDWAGLKRLLDGDPVRLRGLIALERVAGALGPDGEDARRVVHQEVLRLRADAAATARLADEEDVLTQAASLLEWGAQKLPELAELDVSDLLMAKAIADIRASADEIRHTFVDHRQLQAIHPIDRATAEAKCEERARAARAALPLLRAHGMRLSEDLIAAEPSLAAFQSVTGFQVLAMEPGYVTFEGNGRRESLQRAFGDEPVFVEVRLYVVADPARAATLRRRVERVQRWKGV